MLGDEAERFRKLFGGIGLRDASARETMAAYRAIESTPGRPSLLRSSQNVVESIKMLGDTCINFLDFVMLVREKQWPPTGR